MVRLTFWEKRVQLKFKRMTTYSHTVHVYMSAYVYHLCAWLIYTWTLKTCTFTFAYFVTKAIINMGTLGPGFSIQERKILGGEVRQRTMWNWFGIGVFICIDMNSWFAVCSCTVWNCIFPGSITMTLIGNPGASSTLFFKYNFPLKGTRAPWGKLLNLGLGQRQYLILEHLMSEGK